MVIEDESGRRTVDMDYKDCNCGNHRGPHWVHEQRRWKIANDDILRQQGRAGHKDYIREEKNRLTILLAAVNELNLSQVPVFLL